MYRKVSIIVELFSFFFKDTLTQAKSSFYSLFHSLNTCLLSTSSSTDTMLSIRNLKAGKTQSHSSNGSQPTMEIASGVIEVEVT